MKCMLIEILILNCIALLYLSDCREAIHLKTYLDIDLTQDVNKPDEVDFIVCENGIHCSDGSTCCQLLNLGYGCCAYSHAVCCPDNKHCCPNGQKCSSSGQCRQSNLTNFTNNPIKITEGIKPKMLHSLENILTDIVETATKSQDEGVVCPDGQSQCPDGDTCCRTSSGYGCCPKPNAVCCSDMKHCCPEGYTCSGTQCIPNPRESFEQILSEIMEAAKIQNQLQDEGVVCPDGQSQCPDGDTCCRTSSGYGCCPKPNAVCCSDMKHCCPEGYTCSGTQCVPNPRESYEEILSEIMEAAKIQNQLQDEEVVCPDGHSECSDGDTCCRTSTGYGCCPKLNAVCCSDLKHCCPEGYNCSGSECVPNPRESFEHILSEIMEAAKIQNQLQDEEVESVMCPDNQHECPDGDTCCPTSTGYGCCPELDAMCCSDMKHCCPKGYTCPKSGNQCVRNYP